MIYPYKCECGTHFEVIKKMSEIDREERCECGKVATRYIGLSHFNGASDWNRQSFNPAFGQVVKSKAHQREILRKFKDQGKEMIEIGNEKPDTIEKQFTKQREEARAKRWAEV